MKKIKLLLISCSILSITSYSQITKNNWLVGGNGRFSLQKQTLNSSDVKGLNINLSPNIGYFFVDKFAGGIRTMLSYNEVKFNGVTSRTTQTGLGPFFRYYVLGEENFVNMFSEVSYNYINYSSNTGNSNSTNSFTFAAGPSFFLNSSVAIELTANYELLSSKATNTSAKTFFIAIGFQIHLEKENNY